VQDLSATGMRIRMGWKTPKIDSVHTFLITNDDVRFLVSGRVTRVSKTGLLSREVGIEFIGMDESAREGLANIVRNTINTEVLRYNQAA
jgi:c-di-GMP-binding flagellar brake protein YcgR